MIKIDPENEIKDYDKRYDIITYDCQSLQGKVSFVSAVGIAITNEILRDVHHGRKGCTTCDQNLNFNNWAAVSIIPIKGQLCIMPTCSDCLTRYGDLDSVGRMCGEWLISNAFNGEGMIV